ncbi:MAG: hypothetical protein ABR534_14320 [Desulfotignum sp.]|nr:hypothetical protein [Desulfobacteraceae bacterium]
MDRYPIFSALAAALMDPYDHFMARTASEEMLFHTIQVDDDTLRFTAFDMMKQQVDAVVIQKNIP